MIHSFDVFDTVLTRACGHPFGIFVAMAEVIRSQICKFPKTLADEFVSQRVTAEKLARERSGQEEVTLENIYQILSTLISLSDGLKDLLQRLEIETEIRLARPVPEMLSEIRRLQEKNERVIFVSDFYHSAGTVKDMLTKIGVSVNASQLYVSSEIGLTKATGNLFRHVLASEECRPRDILHTGDNLLSDVKKPKSLGIRTRRFTKARLTRREALLSNPSQMDVRTDLLSRICGAMRLARLDVQQPGQIANRTLFEIGATVAAPILVPFVSWVIARARKARIDTLFFVARDGQILKIIADQLLAKSGVNLKTVYLYGSRQAWHLPAIRDLSDREFAWILNLDRNTTVSSLATRLGLDANTFCGFARKWIARDLRPDSPVLRSDLVALAKCIRSEDVSRSVFRAAANARVRLLKYLSETQFLSHERVGIVDIGWHGNLQTSLVTVLDSLEEKPHVRGYYLGLRASHEYTRGDLTLESFLFGPNRPASKVRHSGFFEIFCAADHGGTIGYHETSSGWAPVLNPLGGQAQISWGLNDMRQGILNFLRHFDAPLLDVAPDSYFEAAVSLFDDFIGEPTREEADAIGSFPFSTDQNDLTRVEFAPVMRAFPSTLSLDEFYQHDCWFRGVLMRSNPLILCYRALLGRNREVFLCGLRRIAMKVGLGSGRTVFPR